MPAGRPSDYTPEIAEGICERLAAGESLRSICDDESMPARSAVHTWLIKHKEFADQYTRARAIQADLLFEECLEIADESHGDMTKDDDGREVVNHEAIQRARLRVDTRKWMAGKLRPKVYGDRVQTELSGPDGGPIQVEGAGVSAMLASTKAKATDAT